MKIGLKIWHNTIINRPRNGLKQLLHTGREKLNRNGHLLFRRFIEGGFVMGQKRRAQSAHGAELLLSAPIKGKAAKNH